MNIYYDIIYIHVYTKSISHNVKYYVNKNRGTSSQKDKIPEHQIRWKIAYITKGGHTMNIGNLTKSRNPSKSPELPFRTHNNYIMIRDRINPENSRKTVLRSQSQLEDLLANQKPNTDLYIQKYPSDKVINTIILDFDSSKDMSLALKDITKCVLYLEEKKHQDTTIVESGSKGYHLYIKIQPIDFKKFGKQSKVVKVFNKFTDHLIGGIKNYPTLDKNNLSSGINGNIRLINSIHPVTGNKCQILEGYNNWEIDKFHIYECIEKALSEIDNEESELHDKLNSIQTQKLSYNSDYIHDNDLRELMPQIFHNEIHHYQNYSMMVCPFHPDNHPSLMIGKEWFKCKSCGTKGNIWYLIKNGYIQQTNL